MRLVDPQSVIREVNERMNLITALKAKSAETSQRAVAADIGITEGMLSMMLSGRRRAGQGTLAKVIRAYPELATACAIYLLEGLETP